MEEIRDRSLPNRLYYERNKDRIKQKRLEKDDIICHHCKYKTKRLVDFKRHLQSIRHKIASGNLILLD